MGIRTKFTIAILVIAAGVGIASFMTLNQSHGALIEQEAVRIAEIVTTQVLADRAEYTQSLVGKLKRDGTGASQHSEEQRGFIQLPAQFVRNVSQRVAETADDLYSYALMSEWNLNPDQGIVDDFDRWGWAQLVEQDHAFRASGAKPDWEPTYRIEQAGGRSVLRYMRADPASAEGCVSCHNNYEQMPEIMAMREAQGTAPGKSWELGELMGSVKVEVPIDQVAAAAAAGRNKMLTGIAGVFIIGFGLLFVMIHTTIIKPVESSVRQVEGFADKVEAVVDCSRNLLFGAEEQAASCRKATSEADIAGGSEQVANESQIAEINTTIRDLGTVADKNAKSAEEAAFYCTELDSSFSQLRGRLQKILGESKAA